MPTGLTADAGWQIGVSRTLRSSPDEVWSLLLSSQGFAIWLAEGATVPTEVGERWHAPDGSHGEVRSHRPGDRIRLTWQAPDGDHESTVQVATSPASDGRAVLRFHQERLADAAERERQRDRWKAVMDAVESALEDG